MTFDDYLAKYYGFTTQDKKWQRMSRTGQVLLRNSYKMDMTKETKKEKLAKLYPNNK